MASEHTSSHLVDCNCSYCQSSRTDDRKTPETSIVAMPRERKDYFSEEPYETASESDNDRNTKDERIRQAPYLPRIQIWARDNGPYTLRIGHQWFHCDDLLINGDEYRQQTKKLVNTQPSHPAQPTNQVGTPTGSKRKPVNRAQSFQRTRPDIATSRPTTALARQPSNNRIERPIRYESQSIPEPRRKNVVKKSSPQQPGEPYETVNAARPSNAHSASVPSGQLVPYKPPIPDPAPAYKEPRQARPVRPRRISRGSSYQIPVRSKGRKAVRFAPLPG